MGTLERAIEIAVKAHAGQQDKAGESYILHPMRVMMRLASEDARIVGVLHDVREDTNVTEADLVTAGFSSVVLEALEALTQRPREPYEDFIRRAGRHPLAREVKLADLQDNMDPARLARLSPADRTRLQAKYENAM